MSLDADMNSAGFNSYISVADATVYFTERLFSTTWSNAEAETQEAALIWASRLLDNSFVWTGARVETEQPMAFPRYGLYDAEGYYIKSDIIPKQIRYAVCELAMQLIVKDRTLLAEPSQTGLKSLKAGSLSLEFDSMDKMPTIPASVQNWLTGLFKSYRGTRNTVDVVRS